MLLMGNPGSATDNGQDNVFTGVCYSLQINVKLPYGVFTLSETETDSETN